MNLKKVTPRFYVSEQINAHDIGLAAAQGIKTIICNRPDHEQAGQPVAQSIADVLPLRNAMYDIVGADRSRVA